MEKDNHINNVRNIKFTKSSFNLFFENKGNAIKIEPKNKNDKPAKRLKDSIIGIKMKSTNPNLDIKQV